MTIRGEGRGLMEKTILNFHFDYLTPRLRWNLGNWQWKYGQTTKKENVGNISKECQCGLMTSRKNNNKTKMKNGINKKVENVNCDTNTIVDGNLNQNVD